jgi:ATP-dependent RNA helicase DeaD
VPDAPAAPLEPVSVNNGAEAFTFNQPAVAAIAPLTVLDVALEVALAPEPVPEVAARAAAPAESATAGSRRAADTSILGLSDFFETMEIEGHGPLPAHLKRLLKRRGYEQATKVQRLVFDDYFKWKANGRRGPCKMMAQAPTGSGKTLCFMLAILDTILGEDGRLRPDKAGRPSALVILPTRELAVQMALELDKFDLAADGVTSRLMVKDAAKSDVHEQIVFGTAGTIEGFISASKKKGPKKIAFDLSGIETLVLDEADNLLKGGMQNVTLKIKKQLDEAQRPSPRYSQLYFSATFSAPIQKFVGQVAQDKGIKLLAPEDYTTASVRAAVKQYRCKVADADERAASLASLLPSLDKSGGSCLVFMNQRKAAGAVGAALEASVGAPLKAAGFTVAVLTGGMTPEQRDQAFKDFTEGRIKVLVATDVLCRGVNIPSVKTVVHYDLPTQDPEETYIHRCGRCARFTNHGISIAFDVAADPGSTQALDRLEARFTDKETGAGGMEVADLAQLQASVVDADLAD